MICWRCKEDKDPNLFAPSRRNHPQRSVQICEKCDSADHHHQFGTQRSALKAGCVLFKAENANISKRNNARAIMQYQETQQILKQRQERLKQQYAV
jgi:hypothetical protein